MRLFSNWSDLPAKRRHIYVYAGLLIFALVGNSIKSSFPVHDAKESSLKEAVAKSIGIDAISELDAAAQSVRDSAPTK